MRNAFKKKGGFSIVEVVIALSVIVIVTIVSLSIVLSTVTAKRAAVNKAQAQNFADNVWECFKASNSEEEFLAYVGFAEGVVLTDKQTDENGFSAVTHYSEENHFTAYIRVKFSQTERLEFFVETTDKRGESIVSFSYQKGGGR